MIGESELGAANSLCVESLEGVYYYFLMVWWDGGVLRSGAFCRVCLEVGQRVL